MLADCHMHMVLDGVDWKAAFARHTPQPDISWIRQRLAEYAQKGFTYLRDGGDHCGAGAAAAKIAPEYGICYRTPLSPLCQKGHYGAFIGTCYENLQEYAKLVEQTKKQGGNFIKIMISGLMDFDQFGVLTEPALPARQIRELIHIAHDAGLPVMAHANGADAILAAAEAGVDSVEHGAYPDTEALTAMAQSGTVWVPTLSTVGNLRGKGRFSETAVRKILDNAMTRVAEFAAMGGIIAPGTDAGAWAVKHGVTTEYELLSQCGIADAQLEQGIQAIQKIF